MFAALRNAWPLLIGIAFIMTGNGLQGSLLGIRADAEGFPTTVIGFVMSGYYVGFLAGSTLTPRILREVGHVRVFAALASLASTAVLVHGLFIDAPAWFAMRVITGFSYAGLYVVAESWLNDGSTNRTRGQLLSLYMIVQFSGLIAGQLALNLASPGGYELFALVSILVSLAVVPMLLTAVPAPSFAAPTALSLRRLYAISPLGVCGCLGVGVAHGALFAMGPVYAADTGHSVAEISAFMAAAAIGGVALQLPIGRLSDRFDRRRVLTVVALLAGAVASAAMLTGAEDRHLLLALFALLGALSLPLYSLCLAHTNDFLDPGQMVAASGSLILVFGIGAILGPFAVSWIMATAGPAGFFAFLGAVHAAIGLFALYRMTRRAARPLTQQGRCVAVPPSGSPMAAALSPGAAAAGGK